MKWQKKHQMRKGKLWWWNSSEERLQRSNLCRFDMFLNQTIFFWMSTTVGIQTGFSIQSICPVFKKRKWTVIFKNTHPIYVWIFQNVIHIVIKLVSGEIFFGSFKKLLFPVSMARRNCYFSCLLGVVLSNFLCNKYSRVPLMWTPKGRAKSVHISEPSTVVDTLTCGHLE